MTTPMPGGPTESKPLHFIWICDCSGSMKGEKISVLNEAIKQTLPEMKTTAVNNPFATIFVRAIKFSSGAEWINTDPVPLEKYSWFDLEADGVTDLGKALSMVADEMKIPPMPAKRAIAPVLVLLSDGQPTDNFDKGLKKLLDEPWGKKAVRIAIGIGSDADFDVLNKFINNAEIPPFRADNATDLINYIRWASTTLIKDVTERKSDGSKRDGITLPPPPDSAPLDTAPW